MIKTEAVTSDELTMLRGISYVFSILSYLQNEPFCSKCNSFVKFFESVQDKFIELEKSVNKNRDIPKEIRRLLKSSYAFLADLKIPDSPIKQEESGNCYLPSGLCFAESSLEFYEKLVEITSKKEGDFPNGQRK
ncbi:MAG: hypothetical protein ACUVUQ_02305 [Thermodesulfovibrionales bacterium]